MDEFGNFGEMLNTPWRPPKLGYGTPMPSQNSISPYSPAAADPFNLQGRPGVPNAMGGRLSPTGNLSGPDYLASNTMFSPRVFDYEAPNPNNTPAAGEADPFKLSPTQAIVGSAPGIIGGLYGGFSNMDKRDSLVREDLTPDSVLSGASDAFRREKSSLTPNYGESVDRITRRAGDIVKTAERAGTSPGQIIEAAVAANNMAGNQLFDLEQAGASRQSQNRARADQYRNTLGDYQRLSDDRFKQQYAAYDNASKDSFMSAFNTAAGFGMMAL